MARLISKLRMLLRRNLFIHDMTISIFASQPLCLYTVAIIPSGPKRILQFQNFVMQRELGVLGWIYLISPEKRMNMLHFFFRIFEHSCIRKVGSMKFFFTSKREKGIRDPLTYSDIRMNFSSLRLKQILRKHYII